jgi:hypothetical protein
MRSSVELFPATAIVLLGAALFVDHFLGGGNGNWAAVQFVLGLLIGLAVALALLDLVILWAGGDEARPSHRH